MNRQAIPAELAPVAVETLRPRAVLEFDLFLRTGAASQPVLFRACDYPLETDDLRSLAERGVRTLYIAAEQIAAYQRDLRERAVRDREIPLAGRFQILQDVFRAGFLAALRRDCPAELVQNALALASELVEALSDEELILADLFALMQHDYDAFTHATNVSIYGVVLAQALGIRECSVLTKISVGALLHDIGMRKLPAALVKRPAKLTIQELAAVKQHPRDGFTELVGRPDLEWEQLMMVYQHHERPDGRGYPVGVAADELHPWAALCAVVDAFDALTSERPYRKPLSVREALALLEARAGKQFDAEIVQCWIRTVSRKC